MTAVPPMLKILLVNQFPKFQPLKGNDSRAAVRVEDGHIMDSGFQPLKGNDSRAAHAEADGTNVSYRFQPLKGNDSRAAVIHGLMAIVVFLFQPLKGNDSRAANDLVDAEIAEQLVSTPQRACCISHENNGGMVRFLR